MPLRLNKSASFLIKNGIFVFYYNYNYYFFRKEAKQWCELIVSKGKTKDIPKDFLDFLEDRKLIYEY